MSNQRYRVENLQQFCANVFVSLGLPSGDADVAANSLIRSELEGAGSHGISRLAIYSKRLREGRIASTPKMSMETFGSVIKVDGGNGLGQVVAYHTLQAAMPLAKKYGLAGAFIKNSNHFGTAAYFCQIACQEKMVLIAMTNSPPGIPPWGGKRAYFGTNPIAFGFPVRQEPPVIVDMSSSVVARGKIILAAKLGQSIPFGWAIDEEGRETTDPSAALRGAVLPLGGAKGYALAMAIEVVCGVLSGAAFGPHVNNLYNDQDPAANVGHFFLVLDIEKWMNLDDYFLRMDQFLQEVKETPIAKDFEEILYPGERRYRTYLQNKTSGIDLSPEIQQELEQLGAGCGVPWPASVR
ncbi:MAG: malate dehydrogenase [Bacilli bacterium]|nr:malate dehydrogenase [Bacilli bacterium]